MLVGWHLVPGSVLMGLWMILLVVVVGSCEFLNVWRLQEVCDKLTHLIVPCRVWLLLLMLVLLGLMHDPWVLDGSTVEVSILIVTLRLVASDELLVHVSVLVLQLDLMAVSVFSLVLNLITGVSGWLLGWWSYKYLDWNRL